jgi:hypothetical protein
MTHQQNQGLRQGAQVAGKSTDRGENPRKKPWLSQEEFERKLRRERFLKSLPQVMKNHAGNS